MSFTLSSKQLKENATTSIVTALGGDINSFALPKIDKISINVGCGKFESKDKQEIANFVHKITGQKPKMIKARMSISNFKLRAGDITGIAVTLRGEKMYDFLLSLVYISLPRIRDFKGIKKAAMDKNFSGYSLGIENCNIFPQVGFDTNLNFGMQINVVFKTGTEANQTVLTSLNFPFIKTDSK